MQRETKGRAEERRAVELLRGWIVGGVHAGRLTAGDRLPSYRDVADDTGLDLRAVARAYRVLEAEGLVEVRGRSGVFVAGVERIGGRVLAETARWTVGVLREAWLRRMPVPELARFLQECTTARPVRCAFVESTPDQTESFRVELERDLGFQAAGVLLDQLGPPGRDGAAVPDAVRHADYLVTTVFHAADVRPVAQALGKPLIVALLNPAFVRAAQRHLAGGELAVLCVDPRFVERVRQVVGAPYSAGLHGVLATDRAAVARLPASQPVLISEAARQALAGVALPPSFPPEPMVSPASADELLEVLVRSNLEWAGAGGAGPA